MTLSFSAEALIFLVVGLLFVAVTLHTRYQQRRRQQLGRTAPATIVAAQLSGRLIKVRVRFTTADSRTVETEVESTFITDEHKAGEQVMVVYDPADPENVDLAGLKPMRMSFLLVLGLIFTTVGTLQLLGIIPIFDAHQHNW